MPKVSVCLPVYNGERFLAEAIESILSQSHGDWELLIADDRSSDQSAVIAQKYAQRDARIKLWVNEQNLGLFANYNACMQKASGELVKPFAQDDILEPNMLERMVREFAEHKDVRLVSTGRRWIDDRGNETKVIRPFPESRTISGNDVIRYNMIQLSNWVGEPSTVMFRREFLGEGFDVRFYHYGDIEFWFRIVEGGNYRYLNEVLCSFRRHAESSTSSNHAGMLFALDILLLGKKYKQYSEELGESEEHFSHRALEVIALHMDHLVRQDGLTAEKSLTVTKGTAQQREEQLQGYKELSFHALRYITQLLGDYDALRCRSEAERQHLQVQLEDMRGSTSWKITAPLRQLSGRGT